MTMRDVPAPPDGAGEEKPNIAGVSARGTASPVVQGPVLEMEETAQATVVSALPGVV